MFSQSIGKRYAELMQEEHDHDHNDNQGHETVEDGSDAIDEEDQLMKQIHETMERNARQRSFWDQELREMNRWINL